MGEGAEKVEATELEQKVGCENGELCYCYWIADRRLDGLFSKGGVQEGTKFNYVNAKLANE